MVFINGILIQRATNTVAYYECHNGTDSGGYVKFTPKYIIVGGEGGVSEFVLRFQLYSFGNSGPHAKFQNRSLPPSGLY